MKLLPGRHERCTRCPLRDVRENRGDDRGLGAHRQHFECATALGTHADVDVVHPLHPRHRSLRESCLGLVVWLGRAERRFGKESRTMTRIGREHAMVSDEMRAEREKRAVILTSEGERDAKINEAEGEKQRVIKESEAAKQQQINEAEGEAQAILAVATATAEGLKKVAQSLISQGGEQAMQLRVAEAYIQQFGNLAKEGNTLVVPSNLTDLSSMIALATTIVRKDTPIGST